LIGARIDVNSVLPHGGGEVWRRVEEGLRCPAHKPQVTKPCAAHGWVIPRRTKMKDDFGKVDRGTMLVDMNAGQYA